MLGICCEITKYTVLNDVLLPLFNLGTTVPYMFTGFTMAFTAHWFYHLLLTGITIYCSLVLLFIAHWFYHIAVQSCVWVT